MKKKKYKIAMKFDHNVYTFKTVKGIPIKINGIKCFSFQETNKSFFGNFKTINISHLATGAKMGSGLSLSEAIHVVCFNLKKEKGAIAKKIKALSKFIKLPVNK